LRGKKGRKNHPKKRARALPFVLARWRQKKKSGLGRRKLVMLLLDCLSLRFFVHTPPWLVFYPHKIWALESPPEES
jgi:hypothetical protein